ncbi:MAG TPA: SHOCT domain-containing protein [Sphingomonadaceae bacterium]|nr:SHOCT domain-containing protein [Sphingomonadaceae bacterium]
MGTFSETVMIEYPYWLALDAFNDVMDYFVAKVFADTSPTAQKLAYASAAGWASQSLFVAGLAMGSLKGKGVHHPKKDESVIAIPTSAWSYGGSMTAKLLQGETADRCEVKIFAKTQGLRSSPARKPVNELSEFLAHRFVEFAQARGARGSERNISLAEGLQSLAHMKEAGHLSEEEFQQAKSKLLGNS